jgi:hypothetical protein
VIRIAVLLAISVPLALLLLGTGRSTGYDRSTSSRPRAGAGAGAYGQKRSDSGLGWNRLPGGSSAGSRFWDFTRGRTQAVEGDDLEVSQGGDVVVDLGEGLPLTTFDGGALYS